MARPEPNIIKQHHDREEDRWLDIIPVQSLWIICYKGQMISTRYQLYTSAGLSIKYPRAAYAHPAHAYRYCQRLNHIFNCDDFTVKEIK